MSPLRHLPGGGAPSTRFWGPPARPGQSLPEWPWRELTCRAALMSSRTGWGWESESAAGAWLREAGQRGWWTEAWRFGAEPAGRSGAGTLP